MTKQATVKISGVTVTVDSAALVTLVDSICGRGKKLDKDIHRAGVSCLYHAREHGDVTLAERLIKSLPRSSRRKAFNHWAESHCPLTIEDDGKEKVTVKLAKDRKPGDFDLEGAAAKPFWCR